jgi:TPR repeat protein
MRLLKTLLVLFVCAASPAAAGPLEDAEAAHSKGDYATAVRLYRPLADQGNATAQLRLGFLYSSGRGVPKDDAAALSLFRKAADQGDARAQNNLGLMYEDGRGVPKNDATAVSWYRKAADQGHARAQNNLGLMYENGRGVPKDYVQAYKWISLSISRYSTSDNDLREKAIKSRAALTAKMTPVQIAESQKLAREWKPK